MGWGQYFFIWYLSRRDKTIFSWWMVSADSNVIIKRRFCWLHPPQEYYLVSSRQIYHPKKLNWPNPPWDNLVVSSWQISNEKKVPPPHHKIILSSCHDKFQIQKNCCKPLQITPCRIRLPWPYVVGFSAMLTYNALSDPNSHYFQWFPRLGGPREANKKNFFSQTGLALTSRLRAGIGQLLPGWRTKNNWQWFKARLYKVKCHMTIIPFPVYSVYTYQLLLSLRKQWA